MDVFGFVKEKLEEKLNIKLDKYLEFPKPEFGDLAITLAFEKARKEKIGLNEAAQEIARRIEDLEIIDKVEVVNGYVNLSLNWKILGKEFLTKSIELPNIGKSKKIIIEHTSVNPNKALHIGHLRNACLGDSLARLLKKVGYDVKVLNYIDDTGLQIGYHLLAFKELGYNFDVEKKFDIYASEIYPEIIGKVKENPELEEKARKIIKRLEEGDEEILNLAEKFVRKVLLAQLQTLWNLNIFYDLLNFESHIILFDLWKETFEKLKSLGLVKKVEDGKLKDCWVFEAKGKEFENLKEADKVLVRSDGTLVYTAKDIAYAMWKHGLIDKDFKYVEFVEQPNGHVLYATHPEGKAMKGFNNVEISINVIDVRQTYVQKIVQNAIERLNPKAKYIHYAYEVVALSRGTASLLGIETDKEFLHMSGRKGVIVNVDDVYNTLLQKIMEETKKRNPDMDEKLVREISEKIAKSTLRYELIKMDRNKILVFDIVDSLKIEGDTASYLQYSYVRGKNVLKKYGKNVEVISKIEDLNKEEKELLKTMAKLPFVIEKSVNLLDLSIIANYAISLANSFNLFYEKHRVVGSEKEVLRLNIVKRFLEIMEICFEIMGIEKLEVM